MITVILGLNIISGPGMTSVVLADEDLEKLSPVSLKNIVNLG